MSRSRFLAITAFALLAAACSDPGCPKSLVQRGNLCKHCPEGSVAKHDECVTVDGGQVVDPVEGLHG